MDWPFVSIKVPIRDERYNSVWTGGMNHSGHTIQTVEHGASEIVWLRS
jgi:hypothetical protein